MTLSEVAGEYRTIRPLSTGAEYLLRRTVTLFEQHLGREPTTADLQDLPVSRFVEWLEKRQAKWTVSGNRTRILTIWRFAARRGYCQPPGEVRRCRPPEPMPEAWTVEQVRRLLECCQHLNPRARAYFRALILVAYETGLRKSDLDRLPREAFGGCLIEVRQHKTQRPHVVEIREETRQAVAELPGESPLRSPWCAGRTQEYWFRL
jgi:integrase